MKGQNFLSNSGGSSPQSSSAAPRRRFALIGRSATLDAARDVVRDDLADVELADRVFAPHYAKALARKVVSDEVVRCSPKPDAEVAGAISRGDRVELFDISGGWAWVRSADAVGYVPAEALGQP
jgi:Bacterial dipeptidyl-peptidase Sh3 domain